MIEGLSGRAGYRLTCDCCGDECDGVFETFYDAVAYKVDKANGWAGVKDKYGGWNDLCPSCNTIEVIAKLKGVETNLAHAEFEGF